MTALKGWVTRVTLTSWLMPSTTMNQHPTLTYLSPTIFQSSPVSSWSTSTPSSLNSMRPTSSLHSQHSSDVISHLLNNQSSPILPPYLMPTNTYPLTYRTFLPLAVSTSSSAFMQYHSPLDLDETLLQPSTLFWLGLRARRGIKLPRGHI